MTDGERKWIEVLDQWRTVDKWWSEDREEFFSILLEAPLTGDRIVGAAAARQQEGASRPRR